MSKTIDERVIEMRFDNKQFENNVQTSLSTLDKLKQSLNLKGASKGLENIGDITKNISFDTIVDGITSLQKHFSTLGVIGTRVLERLTDSAIDFVNKGLNFVTNGIVQGGLKRSQNIENAHFQLQGLLQDEEKVQAIMKNALDSVDGTAYGYGDAAKAASQFAATGLKAGKEMESALAAIAGTAAMTNSEYEDISNIFTTVAGNGRLMSMQLLQLSGRGLNAAATLKDYFNGVNSGSISASDSIKTYINTVTEGVQVTEADIREMVSDSKITFEVFTSAMDNAFGKHAKAANKTFTGALSNVRAALSRIGAEFISPLIEQEGPFVKLFNALRERINDVKKNIVPLAKIFTTSVSTMANSVTKHLEKLDLTKKFKAFYYVVDSLKNIFSSLKRNFKIVGEAFKEVFPKTSIDGFVSFSEKLKTFTAKLKLTATGTKNLKNTFKGLFVIVNVLYEALSTVIGVIFSSTSTFNGLNSEILNFTGSIGEWIASIGEAIHENDIFNEVLETLKNLFGELFKVVNIVGDAFKETFTSISIKPVVSFVKAIADIIKGFKLSNDVATNLKSTFKGLFSLIDILIQLTVALIKAILPKAVPLIKTIVSKILSITGAIGEWIVSLDEFIKRHDLFNRTIEKFQDFLVSKFEIIRESIQKLIDTIKEFAETHFVMPDTSEVDDFSDRVRTKFEPLTKVLTFFKNAGIFIINVLKELAPIASALGKALFELIHRFAEALAKAFNGDGLDTLVALISGRIAVGTGLGIMKFVDSLGSVVKKANGMLSNFNAILFNIKNTFISLSKGISATFKADVLMKIAKAMLILSAALLILSLIDSEKLAGSLLAVTTLFIDLTTSMAEITKIMGGTKSSFGLSMLGTAMIEMAIALLIMSAALKKISDIDTYKMEEALLVISTLIAELTIVTQKLSSREKDIKMSLVGLIAFAEAIKILAKAVVILGGLDMMSLAKGLIGVIILMATLSAFIDSANFEKFKISSAIAIIGLSTAMLLLGKAIKNIGELSVEDLAKGLAGIVVGLWAISETMKNMPKDTASIGLGLIEISIALKGTSKNHPKIN